GPLARVAHSPVSDESIASDVYAAIKQGMREQRKDASFHIIKKYHNIVFKII
ncbi:hypothetical protein PtrCC142_011360, partial [Pyrenophora tritici-repentis]